VERKKVVEKLNKCKMKKCAKRRRNRMKNNGKKNSRDCVIQQEGNGKIKQKSRKEMTKRKATLTAMRSVVNVNKKCQHRAKERGSQVTTRNLRFIIVITDRTPHF
jgi:hypothetical protein